MQHLKQQHRRVRHMVSAPFIYGVFLPVVVLDFSFEIYHRICFPLYGLPYVRRGRYVKIDRQKLSYLSWLQKVNCMFCGYVNGLIQYWFVMAGETEAYWCGIRHEKKEGFVEPAHHADFADYGDEAVASPAVNPEG